MEFRVGPVYALRQKTLCARHCTQNLPWWAGK
jgi:hypothetical protein